MYNFGKTFIGIFGIKTAHMQNKPAATDEHNTDESGKRKRYSGIPTIPADIGYNSGGKATGGSHSTGVLSNVSGNPAVILGMGLTTAALLGMIRRSVLGDKVGTQKYMRYRIIAQFFTVFALVAGVTVFASTAPTTPPPSSSSNSAN